MSAPSLSARKDLAKQILLAFNGTKSPTPLLLDLWVEAMGDHSLEEIREAAKRLARIAETGHLSPQRLRQAIERPYEHEASQAFSAYVRTLQNEGQRLVTGSQADNPAAEAALAAIGGGNGLNCDQRQLPERKAQFIAAYNEARKLDE